MSDDLFLGLDSSTQGVKGTVIDSSLNIVYEQRVNFDDDLPEFKTEGGVHRHNDGLTVTSPAIMWVAALDLLIDRLKHAKCELARIAAVSGSGQQHGSVWMKPGAESVLNGLDPQKTLREQLANVFSTPDSPVWMDASTSKQCRELEDTLGGPQAVADLTGSRAYERFTGNQIAKMWQQNREAYDNSERILLVSSFVASLLAGKYVSVDTSDGSGMNLMNVRTKEWAEDALAATTPDLADKLGCVVPGHTYTGNIHGFYVEKYGFSRDCVIIAFSGDNPNSLAGLRLQEPGDVAISLGTSDTMFGSVADPKPSATEGHILANPVDPNGYMAMICYQNGSITREFVRDEFVDGTWEGYRAALTRTAPGNSGHMGFYIKEPEITPPILKTGVYRFGPNDGRTDSFPVDVDARAILETQFMSMRVHCGNIGLNPRKILVTGGASKDQGVIRVIADVFGVTLCSAEVPDSAALGAAYRALHGWACKNRGAFVPFAAIMAKAKPFKTAIRPDTAAHGMYTDMLDRFKKLEAEVVKEAGHANRAGPTCDAG